MSEAVVRGICDIVRVSKRYSVPALKVKEGIHKLRNVGGIWKRQGNIIFLRASENTLANTLSLAQGYP